MTLFLCVCRQSTLAAEPEKVALVETESSARESRPLSFNQDVRPILSDKCFHCHGPDAENQDSEFRLDTQEHALADLGGYFGIKPGDLNESEMHL
ncbi:MAG: c-type cytochrome domain-containing protein, partial [Planctomycetota bacterium]